jgi:hypothetical protein
MKNYHELKRKTHGLIGLYHAAINLFRLLGAARACISFVGLPGILPFPGITQAI